MAAANGDKQYALRLYIWNARVAEALYLPAQIAEVVVRNAIHAALLQQYGTNWYSQVAFRRTLPNRLDDQLTKVLSDEQQAYGRGMTVDHVISGLMFGFWVHLLTSNYDNALWPKYFASSFPNMPAGITRQTLYDKAEKLRLFRNKIAHHKPVFDRRPTAEFNSAMELVGWVCKETLWLARATSRVQRTIGGRPTS